MNSEIIGRLRDRRKNIEITLDHLRDQQNEVEQNTEWRDLRAQRRRTELLAELLGWYNSKLRRVDAAINRFVLRKGESAPRGRFSRS
jgi:hypothetical protein